VLVVQNDAGNRYSPTVIVLALTSQMEKPRLPTHVPVRGQGLRKDSVVLAEQIRTLDKRRLRERMGHLEGPMMDAVDKAIAVSMGIRERLV
jgi:mRNA interferase MazF